MLLNLVMNGVEAMNEVPEASRKIWVRAQPSEHNGSPAVLISVQDSGRGLKQADAKIGSLKPSTQPNRTDWALA